MSSERAEAEAARPSQPNATQPRSSIPPVLRQHASDEVFRQIAAAILNRELTAGTPLPPERQLAERFRVSRIVVREAIHRLKEYELVRVRQGSPTIVLDPDEATDIRLLGLEIDLLPHDEASTAAFAERTVYAAAALLDLSEQRMTSEELDEIEELVAEFVKHASDDNSHADLPYERAYWIRIAQGTKNRIYVRETLWYFNLMQREERFMKTRRGTAQMRAMLYQSMLKAQRERSGSAVMYLRALRAFDSHNETTRG